MFSKHIWGGTMTDRDVLRIQGIKALYDGNLAVDVAALAVEAGQMVGVIGANGAGKSTFLNAIMRWSRGSPAVSGAVHLDGRDISDLPAHRRVQEGLLLVPEGKLVFASLSVEENLIDEAVSTGSGRKFYTVDDVFQLFPRLKERRNHKGSQLSGGERQMLGIGRALRMAPRVLMLDEPSIGLAPKLVSRVLETVRDLARDGLSVLLVEQNAKAAIRVVDRLALFERGRIVMSGTADEMRDNPRIVEVYLGTT